MSVAFNTMEDKSTSKIAEMMLQGTNMGIIKGVKLLNHNPNTDEPVKSILTEFVQFQENTVKQLKNIYNFNYKKGFKANYFSSFKSFLLLLILLDFMSMLQKKRHNLQIYYYFPDSILIVLLIFYSY